MTKRILYVSSEYGHFSETNLFSVNFNGFEHTHVYDMFRAERKLTSRKYSGLIVDGLNLYFSKEFPETKSPGHVAILLGIAKKLDIPSLVISDEPEAESRFNIKNLATRVLSYPLNPFEYSKIIKQLFHFEDPTVN